MELDIRTISTRNIQDIIDLNRETKNVICLIGHAGIGKTKIVEQIAKGRKPAKSFVWNHKKWDNSVPLVVLNLAQMQQEDIGLPYPSVSRHLSKLQEASLLFDIFSKTSEDGYKQRAEAILETVSDHDNSFEFLLEKSLSDLPQEGVLFLDEWNRANREVIKAFFTIVESRTIHGKKVIPDGIQIVCAMNPSGSDYDVNEMENDHAIRRRLLFVNVRVDPKTWIDYAKENKFNKMVVEFVNTFPSALYDEALMKSGKVFPNPAAWEKVSEVLEMAKKLHIDVVDNSVIEASIAGAVGSATTHNLIDFIKDQKDKISADMILEDYKSIREKLLVVVKEGRNDLLKEYCLGAVIKLCSDTELKKETIENFLSFLLDIPKDLAASALMYDFEEIGGKDPSQKNKITTKFWGNKAYGELVKSIKEQKIEPKREVKEENKEV